MALAVLLLGLLALAALAPALGRRLGRGSAWVLSAGTAVAAVGVATLAPGVLAGRPVEASWAWLPSLGVRAALRLDGASLVFVLVALVVGALVLAYCASYLDDEQARGPVLPLLVVFAAAMCALVLADDLVLLYLAWEATTVCSFLLVSTAGTASTAPARRALLVTVAGGLALLIAVVLVVAATGTTRLSAITADPSALLASPLAGPAAALVVVAAATKSAQMPFHFWLPGAMVAMTPVSAYLHAATMVKAGIYLLVRTTPLFAELPWWTPGLLALGLSTAVLGAVLALREHDLKAVLAHSTVSQLGLLVAAIAVGTPTALAAALLHTGAHALFKATLFMLVGIVDHETGGRDVRDLSGLRRVMPRTAAATAVAALSMAGVPPLLGFVSKEYLYQGLLTAGPVLGPVAGGAAVLASALTFAYAARIVHGAFGGGEVSHPALHEPPTAFLAPAALAAAAGLALGPAVSALDPVVAAATRDALPGSSAPEVYFWHGLSTEVVMSLVAVALGLALFRWRAPVDRWLHRARPPSTADAFDRGHDALLRLGGALGAPDRAGGVPAQLVRPLLGLLAVGALAVGALGTPAAPVGGDDPLEPPLVALVAVVLVVAVTTASSLVLVAVVGLAGLLLALWLLLRGAVDVAVTLLLVEVLTAVALVLVLRGRPSRMVRPARRSAAPAALLALGVAVVAGAGTHALTGRSARSPVSAELLARAEELTGGTNVVNTVLADFRALDTFLETVVVGVVALGLVVLGRGPAGRRAGPTGPSPQTEDVVLRVGARLLVPLSLVLAGYLLLRGHDEPGGGFIAALVVGTAVALGHLAGGSAPLARTPRPMRPSTLAGAGLLVALGTGLVPLLGGGALLEPFDVPLLGALGIGSVLLFEVGVLLLVLALAVAAVHSLDGGTSLGGGPDGAADPADRPAGDARRTPARRRARGGGPR